MLKSTYFNTCISLPPTDVAHEDPIKMPFADKILQDIAINIKFDGTVLVFALGKKTEKAMIQ